MSSQNIRPHHCGEVVRSGTVFSVLPIDGGSSASWAVTDIVRSATVPIVAARPCTPKTSDGTEDVMSGERQRRLCSPTTLIGRIIAVMTAVRLYPTISTLALIPTAVAAPTVYVSCQDLPYRSRHTPSVLVCASVFVSVRA